MATQHFTIEQLEQFKQEKGYQVLAFDEEGRKEEFIEWCNSKETPGEKTKRNIQRILLREIQEAKIEIRNISTYAGQARGRSIDPMIRPSLNLINYSHSRLQRMIDGIETKIKLYID